MGKFRQNVNAAAAAAVAANAQMVVTNRTRSQEPQLKLKKRTKPLKVCVMSADFWGLKTAGGTATAYHLLAAMLARSHALEVGLSLSSPSFQFSSHFDGCAVL